MHPKILVVGGLGNMGSRYCRIFKALGVEYTVSDIDLQCDVDSKTTGIIIATPTDTHYGLLKQYQDSGLPILCEKPISMKQSEMKEILRWDIKLRMINQYEYYFRNDLGMEIVSSQPDHYNYFKTGSDGLLWNCMNVIGTNGKRDVHIDNTSPVWSCQIKGKKLGIEKMDWAYIWNIRDWLDGTHDNKEYIGWIHNKIHKMIKDKQNG